MKKATTRHVWRFYLWTTAAYLFFQLVGDMAQYPGTFIEQALNDVWRTAAVVAVNYILFEYTLPFIRKERRYLASNILLAVPLLFFYLMIYSWGLYAWKLLGISLHIFTPDTAENVKYKGVTEQMAFSVGSVFFFGIARHIYNYIRLKQSAQQLRIEKQSAELNYLKSQTNPHFLFNTLNNIYSLSRDKSDLAPESILRLSKILRYMLYEAGGKFIAIEQELKIISDYIELEKLRYDDSLDIQLLYEVEDMKQGLPPLLLIPLIENAFKHGASETRGNPFVHIHLSVAKRRLLLVVKNSSDAATAAKSIKENIGLSNLRRQLQLLYADHDLSVQQTGPEFTAALKINLGSNLIH